MIDLKIHKGKQEKVKVAAVRYVQCSETFGYKVFGNFVNL